MGNRQGRESYVNEEDDSQRVYEEEDVPCDDSCDLSEEQFITQMPAASDPPPWFREWLRRSVKDLNNEDGDCNKSAARKALSASCKSLSMIGKAQPESSVRNDLTRRNSLPSTPAGSLVSCEKRTLLPPVGKERRTVSLGQAEGASFLSSFPDPSHTMRCPSGDVSFRTNSSFRSRTSSSSFRSASVASTVSGSFRRCRSSKSVDLSQPPPWYDTWVRTWSREGAFRSSAESVRSAPDCIEGRSAKLIDATSPLKSGASGMPETPSKAREAESPTKKSSEKYRKSHRILMGDDW